jgi:signal peptidase I
MSADEKQRLFIYVVNSASMEMTKRFRDLVNVLKEKLVGRLQVNSVL